jgi:hypothetical protein
MGLSSGINLEKLLDAGQFICKVLDRPTQSKVARALAPFERQSSLSFK